MLEASETGVMPPTQFDAVADIPAVQRALAEFDSAIADVRALRDKVATTLYGLLFEVPEDVRRWLVPPTHRPTCPLDNRPCTSWTCLVDVCVDAKKDASGGENMKGAEGDG